MISEVDIDRYERDGAVVIRGVLGRAAQRLLEEGVETSYRTHLARSTQVVDAAGAGRTVVLDYAAESNQALSAFIEEGSVGRIAAALMRTRSAQLVLDQVFYKLSGAIIETPWHQDTPFLRVRGDSLIRLWFPCDPSPSDLTVQVVRGSHRWNVVYNTIPGDQAMAATGRGAKPREEGAAVGDDWLPTAPDVRRHRDSFDILKWSVMPGDVLAFQGNMLHGTDGHPGHPHPRRAFAVLLGGPELRHHKPQGKAFPSPGRRRGLRAQDDLPDGAPIGDHPDAFPFCWRELQDGSPQPYLTEMNE